MKNLKRYIVFFLSFLMIIGDISFVNLVKADGNIGYIYVYYKDANTNKDIKSLETMPINLDQNGKGTGYIPEAAISGYKYKETKINGVINNTPPPLTVPVTSSNTIDNPVKVYIYYSKNSSIRTVTIHGMYIHSDGSTEPFSETSKTAPVPQGGQAEVDTTAPTPPNPSYYFLYSTVGLDGEHSGSKDLEVPVTTHDVDVYYWFGASTLGAGTVRVTTGDHVLENGKVVNESDGKDYFARADVDYNVDSTGHMTVSVKSPSMGSSKSGYQFAFALVEHSGGNPNNALTNYIEKKNSLQFDTTVDTSSTMWYVHFYWIKKDDSNTNPTNPSSGNIVFNPNKTSWTFDSIKSPGWSNSWKINNGNGDYPVNSKFVGNNPSMAKGTVTYTYQLKHTGTTGNPPHSYTYWTDESYSESFDVSYYLKNMTISGDDNPNPTTFEFPDKGQGTSFPSYDANGDVHIKKEGVNLGLSGVATWYDLVRDRDYKVPAFHAGGTTRNVQEHLKLPQSPAKPTGQSSTYKLDWTNPTIDFSVQPGIFSTDRKAVRKASKKGEGDAYYGTLTFKDNLSGCKSLRYGWTFGNNPSKADYETIYTSDYTDNDRSSETITREIEKPVGDDLYLHTKLVDMAGNETDKTFGPFEDPIKLKNFRVIDVTDPTWENVFWKDCKDFNSKSKDRPKLSQPTNKEFKANELPLDSDSNPYGTYIKKGYAFYFKLDSEYLYRDNDRIEIEPTFYYWDGKTRKQVDAYYNKDNNPFIKVGGSQDTFKVYTYPSNISPHGNVELGGYNKLTLTKAVRDFKGRPFYNGWKDQIQYVDGKDQYWYGQYYLPDDTIFAEKGKSPVPTNILKKNYIIINFQIKAYKNGKETNSSSQIFTYVPNQWRAENGPKSTKYKSGDVIVYDNKHAIFNNWQSVITN